MEPRHSAYLDAVSWTESLARLSAWAAADAPIENALRLSRHLAMLAPPPFGLIAQCALDEAAFDELLERQAFEAAATVLIGTALSYEVVSGGGTTPATVRVWRDGDGETRASAETLALALVRAWAAFMLGLASAAPNAQATGSSQRSA